MARWQWLLLQMLRRLWVRATLIGALSVAAAGLATLAERFAEWQLPFDIGADALDSVLSIIASSMLAVTTFSLSVMTSAYGAATSSVTPRATRLLMQDGITQNVLSTFIGAFLFSIAGIVVSKAGAYGPHGRVVLFIVTIGVIVLVVVSLLSWIDYLTRLGRVGETTDRVEQATRTALEVRARRPYLGGVPQTAAAPEGALMAVSSVTGYVQHIDMAALSACSERMKTDIHLAVVPGTFVYCGAPLARMSPHPGADEAEEADEEVKAAQRQAYIEIVQKAFSIGSERGFDQDPRFGFVVLTEIASRALSPATNDSGTAIDVIGRSARLLTLWATLRREQQEHDEQKIEHPHVHVPPLTDEDLFDDAFRLIGRDGAALLEVQMRLQKALRALGGLGDDSFRAAAHAQARLALARAETAMQMEEDKALLRAVAQAA